MIDVVIMFLLFVALFIPTNAIATHSKPYLDSINLINTYREDSGLFTYERSTKTYIMWPTYYDNYATADPYVKVDKCDTAVNNFIKFVGNKLGEEKKQLIQKDYDDYRLSLYFEGEPYFVLEDGVVVTNKLSAGGTCLAKNEDYYTNVYKIYVVQQCGGYLTTLFPEYLNASRLTSNILFFAELPIAFSLAAILTYFVPPLFLRRGRKTIGKLIYKIGLVDPRYLSPTFPRFLIRFLIFFVFVLTLSFFTFGIPLIISFSMMAFSKKKQGFPDYMVGCIEVDNNLENIYFNKYEVTILKSEDRKEAVKFNSK